MKHNKVNQNLADLFNGILAIQYILKGPDNKVLTGKTIPRRKNNIKFEPSGRNISLKNDH